jgi:hypothetical protein
MRKLGLTRFTNSRRHIRIGYGAHASYPRLSRLSASARLLNIQWVLPTNRWRQTGLVFVYDGNSGWQIQNIGAGLALNIIIAKKDGGSTNSSAGDWINPVRIPPLKKDGAFPLHWDPQTNPDSLGATYEDMWGRKYTTICRRDLNLIESRHRLREWTEGEVKAEWTLRKP